MPTTFPRTAAGITPRRLRRTRLASNRLRRGMGGFEAALILAGAFVAIALVIIAASHSVREAGKPIDGTVTAKYTKQVYRAGEVSFLTVNNCYMLDRPNLGPIRECEDVQVDVDVHTWAGTQVGDHYHRDGR
jgi:hypothetical protein